MRKFLFFLAVIFTCSGVTAQNIDKIKDMIAAGKWPEAKTAIDDYLSKEKNAVKWDGWWYKGVIYNEIAKSDEHRSLAPDGRMEAFKAFKKYYEIDDKMLQAVLEQHVRIFDIYYGYFNDGIKHFNDDQQYENAMSDFKNALEIGSYIVNKGFEYTSNGQTIQLPEFDTLLIRNVALAAFKCKKEDEAVRYYKMIADKKIGGEENLEVYQYLVDFYHKKKDMAEREKYLQLGNELYPNDGFWYQTELSDVDLEDKKALYAKYEELTQKYPNQFVLAYNYGIELFNYVYSQEKKPDDYKQVQAKLEKHLKRALELNKDFFETNLVLYRHYENMYYDLELERNAIKGKTPEDVKKKNEIQQQVNNNIDQMLVYALAVYNNYSARNDLKAAEKANLRKVVDSLIYAYEARGMKDKMAEYEAKKASLN